MVSIMDKQTSIYTLLPIRWRGAKQARISIFRRKEVEVLILTDRVDEWMLSFLSEFEGKSLGRLQRAIWISASLRCAEKEEQASGRRAEQGTNRSGQSVVGPIALKDVRITLRLTDHPRDLVADEHAMIRICSAC